MTKYERTLQTNELVMPAPSEVLNEILAGSYQVIHDDSITEEQKVKTALVDLQRCCGMAAKLVESVPAWDGTPPDDPDTNAAVDVIERLTELLMLTDVAKSAAMYLVNQFDPEMTDDDMM